MRYNGIMNKYHMKYQISFQDQMY